MFYPLFKSGDIICMLNGFPLPVVLRKCEGGYVNMGACHVLGLIDDEVEEMLRSGDVKLKDINIF
jgi:hypothetical protein